MTDPVSKLPRPDATRDERIVRNIDAFISATTGAGYAPDKFTSYTFAASAVLNDQLLEDLWTNHDLAAAIVERIVRDALRSGYELDWSGSTDEERRDVVDWAESTYGVTTEVGEARVFSRLFGGGGVVMGIDGQLESPAILGGPVSFLRATPSPRLQGHFFYGDPSKQSYGQVEVYWMRQLQLVNDMDGVEPFVPIHESRVIPFYGIKTTDQQMIRDKGWGKSVLHRIYDLLLKFDASFDSVLSTLAESSIPVYKVKALLDLLASENGELLAKRFELINTAKGAYKAVILDMDETFERVEASLSEAANVVDIAMVRVAAASGQPATLLFMRAPSGQNATGASDLENWNQQVASEQSLILGPAIRKIYRWLLAQPDSPISKAPDDLKVIFPAVETPTRQELVNEYQQIGATDIGYITAGVVTPEKVALTRAEQPGFFPKIDKAFIRELEELRNERLLDPPDPVEMEPEPPEELAVPAKDAQDDLVFQRDGRTWIRSGGEEFEITGE
jgi:hypothetical protein